MTDNEEKPMKFPKGRWTYIVHELKTVLGLSHVGVWVDELEYENGCICFMPNEEDRIMKEQASKFIKSVLQNDETITATELRYLLRLYEVKI